MKKVCRMVIDEFVFGGHIMSLGAVSIVSSFALLLHLPLDWKFLLATYLGVHSVYLFDRYKDLKNDKHTNCQRVQYLGKFGNKPVKLVIILLALSILLLSLYGGIYIALASLALFMVGFAYSIFFKPLTKKIIGFKDFFVPISYVLLLVIFMFYKTVPFSLSAWLLITFVCLRIFSTEVFYDLKDIAEDKEKNLLTFAVIFPFKRFHWFLAMVNIASFVPIIYGVLVGVFRPSILVLALIVIYFLWYQNKSKKTKDLDLFSYTYCEGEYLLWLPLVLAVRHFWG